MTRSAALTVLAAVATTVLLVAALVVGPGSVTLGRALAVLIGDGSADPMTTALVWDLRLPRALLVAAVGAALAIAGTVTQGLFRNPLAEPGVLGVSVGAATAAVVGFAFGLDRIGFWVTPMIAAAGAALVLVGLLALGRSQHNRSAATLLLAGVAIAALCSAVTTLVLSFGIERADLGAKVIRWLMGSFEGRSWTHLAIAVGPLVVGVGLASYLRLDLDALALGEPTAASLGVDLARAQWVALAAIALLVGMATALCGVIGFVGLVVPHIARMLLGASHRTLIPSSGLLGAIGLLLVDTGSRASTSFALPPGAITSLLGAPFFLWLLVRVAKERH